MNAVCEGWLKTRRKKRLEGSKEKMSERIAELEMDLDIEMGDLANHRQEVKELRAELARAAELIRPLLPHGNFRDGDGPNQAPARAFVDKHGK